MILKRDENYEHVTCPICSHQWYTRVKAAFPMLDGTIFCPSCNAPLRPPTPAGIAELLQTKDSKDDK